MSHSKARQSALMRRRLASRRNASFLYGNPIPVEGIHDSLLEKDRTEQLQGNPDQLAQHLAVLGVSGSGKSKFLELYCRHLFDSLNGFTFIDPHGDTAEALLEYATKVAEERGDETVFCRFHYLKPSPDRLFSFNPFLLKETDPKSFAFAAERDTAVDRMVSVLLRSDTAADQEIQRRLQRWLRNALHFRRLRRERDYGF